jgi:YVTN family beta-propeller protein
MDFRILGPVEVAKDGRAIGLGGAKQRSVLAVLLLHANEAVSVDRLVDELWGEDAPSSAVPTVRVHVSRLRKSLDAGEPNGRSRSVLVTGPDGYRLQVDPGELDLETFERMVEQGRRALAAGDAEQAAGLLREALGLWRGPALADLAYEPFAQAEAVRLEELRVAALEDRIDADLALGRHAEVVSELEPLVTDHPLRERLRAQQMLALYRSGRQAEALDAYLRARRDLVEEVGVEPGPELRELHEAMLRQDPALTPSRADVRPPPEAVRGPPRARPGWRVPAAVAAVAAFVLALVLLLVDGDDPTTALPENSAGRIDPDTGAVRNFVAVGHGPSQAVAGAGSIWIANALDGTVSRVEQRGSQVTTLDVGSAPTGLAFGAGSLWVATAQSRSVSQIDPRTNRVLRTIEVGNTPDGVTVGFGAVWVASTVDGEVVQIDLSRARVTRRIPVGVGSASIATGAGAVWVAQETTGTVQRIEPRSGRVVGAAAVGNGPSDISVGGGAVWVANRRYGTVSRIDPETLAVTETMTVGGEPSAIAANADSVWVATGSAGTVARIDPRSRRVEHTFDVGASPSALALVHGSVWAAAGASPRSHRGGTLRLAWELEKCHCADPIEYFSTSIALVNLAFDGLVGYRRVGGPAGAALVPNLAREVPEPTDGGRTYVFQLRSGIRFSDGRLVRPEDFRHSVERLLRLRGRAVSTYFDAIAGARECVARPDSCDLSEGIETDARTGTITIHLTRPDTELPHALALTGASVVPSDTPMRFVRRPIPGTGPYRIARYDSTRGGRLVRNPHFRVWSREARPDGFPDAIEIDVDRHASAQVAAVTRGEADLVTVAGPFGGPLTPSAVRRLSVRHAGQVFGGPLPEFDSFFLNVRRPPFTARDARRALNYALDRRKLVELAGGPELAQLTCQFLPPGFSGYRPYCPQTVQPTSAGTWTAPDIGRARQLVDASGTKGARVEVWTWREREREPIARYVTSVLRRLGYHASLRVMGDAGEYFGALNSGRAQPQIGANGWYADHLAPSNILLPSFGCASAGAAAPAGNYSRFCKPAIDELARRASSNQGSDPRLANDLWERVDHALVDEAPAIPMFNRRSAVLVSRRVDNVQWHPLWGVLVDQLWVK